MNTTNKVLVGALSGLAVGVVLGVLTAPASGKDTRDKLSMQADKLRKKINKMRNRAEDEMEELEEVFTHEIAGLKEDVRKRVLNLIEAKRNRKVPEPSLS
ncbi:MAG: YtxH domain-containing protein [Chitinophagaceae bacterium]|jgi:gas vesicle protein|nr:YtxH domain-containing protein [Chitinophagaceae bacterium]